MPTKNIRIYDFSVKAAPKLPKHIKFNSNPYAPAFWKRKVLRPGGYAGLRLERNEASVQKPARFPVACL